MEERFTIEEIRNYIEAQDSMGDVLYNLSVKNIIIANKAKENEKEWEEFDKCVHTEHCCAENVCKYGDKNCPVWLGYKKQSFPYWDGGIEDIEYFIPIIPEEEFIQRRNKIKDDQNDY